MRNVKHTKSLKKHKFRNRMIVINLLISIIPLLFLGAISFSSSLENQKRNISEMNDVLFYQISERIEEYCKNIDSLSLNVFYNKSLQDFLLQKPSPLISDDSSNLYQDRIAISNYFSSFFQTNNEIKGIDLYSGDKHYSSDTFVLTQDMYDFIFSTEGGGSEKLRFSNVFLEQNTGVAQDMLIAVRPIKSIQKSNYFGEIARGALVLRRMEIRKLIDDERLTKMADIYILDQAGHVIVSSVEGVDGTLFDRSQYQSSGNALSIINGMPYWYQETTQELSGWQLIAAIPMKNYAAQLYTLSKTMMFLLPVVLVITVGAALYFNLLLARPIRQLAEAFNSVASGNLQTQISVNRSDELSEIAGSFNHMVQEVGELTENNLNAQKQLYEIELEKARFELNGLQMQINAHFLYNTLHCIRGMSQNAPEQIRPTIDLLVKYFRYSNSNGAFVKLENELSHLYCYMQIQNIRYNGRFRILSDIPEELKQYMVLKLTIQPLVENALFHGLEQKAGRGSIKIKARRQEQNLTIQIMDNGAGMDEEELQLLRGRLEENTLSYHAKERSTGIGIVNIQKRIQIYCGKRHGLNVKSWKGIGTVITMTLPLLKESDDLEKGAFSR